MSGAAVMALVAVVAGGLGVAVVLRPARSEAARYGRRIAGTVLIAFCLALLLFAYVLDHMQTG